MLRVMQHESIEDPVTTRMTKAQLAWVFCTALVLMAAVSITAYSESRQESQARSQVMHSLLVMQQVRQLEHAATLMEDDHRGLLVAGDPLLLASRDHHGLETASAIASLRSLTSDNLGQKARLETTQRMLAERMARMHETDALLRSDGIDAARAHFALAGDGSITPLRNAFEEISNEEQRLLSARARVVEDRAARLRWILLLTPVVGITLLGIALSALLAQIRRSEKIAVVIAKANAETTRALALVDATHDGVFIYDADSLAFSYVNQGACSQVGYSRDELLRMNVLDIKRSFDRPAFEQLIAQLKFGETAALAFETLHRHKDGHDVPVEISIRYVASDEDRPSLVSIARDISARKQAQDERDRFFMLSLDMLCISSSDGYFKRLSPAFTTCLGWSIDELLSRPLMEFVHPDDRAATQVEIERQVIAGESVLQFDNRFLHKDGGWRVLSWKSVPQAGGMMYATARDVTESYLNQQRIVELNRDLTERQVALEAANKELEAFSYSVSHDLRAPLRHIDGYARMLEEDAADKLPMESRRFLKTIISSARRMGLLIDDLLALSRFGRKALARQAVDMRELAQRAADELADNDTGYGGAQISIAAIPKANGDPTLLLQVWVNLLSNAIKYSAPRGTSARIEVTGTVQADRVSYSVQDNGVGFDMRYAGKLFGVFQRLHAQDLFEGTGVGLAIVQRIVQRHGGEVSASSEPDCGACFTFTLPIARDSLP